MNLDSIIDAIGVTPYNRTEYGVLYCADCLDILPKIPDKSIDLVLTDPPYGLRSLMRGGGWANNMKYIRDGADWDEEPIDFGRLFATIDAAKQAIVWGGNFFELPPQRGWLVWRKRGENFSMAEAELAWTNLDIPVKVKDYFTIEQSPLHPTQKPLPVMQWAIGIADKKVGINNLILDPFAGSGTTLVAAKQLGRKYIGIEINEDYCKICVERLRQEELF